MENSNEKEMTFWDHLDELRKVFFRIVIAVVLLACIAFFFKDFLFNIILAPQRSDFILYRFFNRLAADFAIPSLEAGDFHVDLINTQLTSQFMIHMSVALYTGILLLFGIFLNYYVIFPLSFRFLATYQVSETVTNLISLSSYISSFTMLSLLLGTAFEIPVIAYFLAKLHLITAGMLKKFRKHSLVAILIVAAIITPTSDVFTLLLVSAPLYLLYELSVIVVSRTNSR